MSLLFFLMKMNLGFIFSSFQASQYSLLQPTEQRAWITLAPSLDGDGKREGRRNMENTYSSHACSHWTHVQVYNEFFHSFSSYPRKPFTRVSEEGSICAGSGPFRNVPCCSALLGFCKNVHFWLTLFPSLYYLSPIIIILQLHVY